MKKQTFNTTIMNQLILQYKVNCINQTNHSWIAHKICILAQRLRESIVERNEPVQKCRLFWVSWFKWIDSIEIIALSIATTYHWIYNQYSSKINATTKHQTPRVSALAGRSCLYVPLGGRGWMGCVVTVVLEGGAVPAAEAGTTAELSLDLRRTTHFAFQSTLLSQRSNLSLLP